MKPVSETASDAGESPSSMEPMLIAEGATRMEGLREQALELSEAAAEFRGRLPATLQEPLAALVRSMNCYYSNLIEGHDTHPIDIERALNDDYSNDPGKRDLQLEATAHIRVQRTIDEGHLTHHPLTPSGLAEIHARFCEHLPDSLLWVDDPKGGDPVRVVPGQWRDRDVAVGRHVPISAGAIPRFMDRFAARYSNLGRINRLLAPACAHHRLLWIHPFIDGNGRVARLMSHALLVESLRTGGVWSVARGLARNEARYKQLLLACDSPRRSERDGRGQLSQEALADFTAFFLDVCIDQIRFMDQLTEPGRLRDRLVDWAVRERENGRLPSKSDHVLEQLLWRGEQRRGAIAGLLDVSERHARRVTKALLDRGIVTADGPRSPLRLALPASLAGQIMPGLFDAGPRMQ